MHKGLGPSRKCPALSQSEESQDSSRPEEESEAAECEGDLLDFGEETQPEAPADPAVSGTDQCF